MLTSAIEKLQKKHDTKDLFQLAEALNIIVYTAELPEQVRAMYGYAWRNKLIALNSGIDEDEHVQALGELIQYSMVNKEVLIHLV